MAGLIDGCGLATGSKYAMGLFVLVLDMGLAIRVYIHVQSGGVAADRAVLDVVLVRPG